MTSSAIVLLLWVGNIPGVWGQSTQRRDAHRAAQHLNGSTP